MVNQIRAGARSQVVVGDYTKRTPSPSDAFSFSVGPNKSYSLVPIATEGTIMRAHHVIIAAVAVILIGVGVKLIFVLATSVLRS